MESQLSGSNYTILSSIDLTDPNQQLIFTTTDGEVRTISLEELLGLMEDLPPGSTFAGYDPFYIPMVVPTNAPTPNFVFYIYDHLGNTRITYSTAVACDASVTYTLEAVIDYYPYGKVLREYSNGQQEKYLSTQHERDLETGLDYRGARFYDADICRFLSLDPLAADFPDWSDYNYVLGNPLMFTDPDGRSPIRVAFSAFKVIKKMHKAYKKGKKFDGVDFLKKEGLDIADGVLTIIDPKATYLEQVQALAEVSVGLDLRTKKGKRVQRLLEKSQDRLADMDPGTIAPSLRPLRDKMKGSLGRGGGQKRLREIQGEINRYGKNIRGWIQQEINQIRRKTRKNIRNPPGHELGHKPDKRAKDGFDHSHSDLQTKKGNRTQSRAEANYDKKKRQQ